MYRLVLLVVALGLLSGVSRAQPTDPSTLPLLQPAELVNVGGFTVPGPINGKDFNYGSRVMAMAADGKSLLLSNNGWSIAQITIPTPVLATTVKALPRATYITPFRQVLTDAQMAQIGPVRGDTFVGLYPYQGRFVGSALVYYDSNNTQRKCHFAYAGLDFTNFGGWSQVGENARCGFVAGSMTPIPAEWQAALGGTTLAIPAAMPIISRTSFGPAASVVDPARIGQPVVTAIPLLYYDGNHATLGPWNGSNPTYGGTTMIGGAVIVPGTRALLFWGSNGVGKHCYGDGTSDKAAADKSSTDELCYDPLSTAKGSHAYPYRYQVWAYDLNDLAAVKAKTKQPWEVKPYGVWPIDLPITHNREVQWNSVAIDPATRRIYVSQYKGEIAPDGGGQPIVWAFDPKVGTPAPVPPMPIPVPEPPKPVPVPVPVPDPMVNCTVQSVSRYADKDARLTVRCNTNGSPLIPKGTAFTIAVKP